MRLLKHWSNAIGLRETTLTYDGEAARADSRKVSNHTIIYDSHQQNLVKPSDHRQPLVLIFK